VVEIIALAFEVAPRDVVVDAAAVRAGAPSHVPIQRWLQHRHGWDPSVAPYYVAHLLRLLQDTQSPRLGMIKKPYPEPR